MSPTDIPNVVYQVGWSSVALLAITAVFRIVAMLVAVRFGYRLTIGKLVFEPADKVKQTETAELIVPIVASPEPKKKIPIFRLGRHDR